MRKKFVTKSSKKQDKFDSGMVRGTDDEKIKYDLIDFPMLKRWAELMGRGAKIYGEENWRKASGEKELKRFKRSALRHMYQWFSGETDEDHAAAVLFNIAGAEYVKQRLTRKPKK